MISEYHMACMVNGPSTTSPLPSQVIEEQLPPLENYAFLQGTGVTDVRLSDHKAKSLQVAVWLHHLDMSLSPEEEASRSLVYSRQIRGHLLDYFLAPGTRNLSFEKVVT